MKDSRFNTLDTRLRGKLRKEVTDLVTIGEQMRLLRELRGFSKEELARRMGCHTGTITKIEKGFLEGVSMRIINNYLNQCHGTFICIPLPMPSGIDPEAHKFVAYFPVYKPIEHNIADDEQLP